MSPVESKHMSEDGSKHNAFFRLLSFINFLFYSRDTRGECKRIRQKLQQLVTKLCNIHN